MNAAPSMSATLDGPSPSRLMGDPQQPPSFGRLFEFHRALEEAISTAATEGGEICPAALIEKLLPTGAQADMSAAEIKDAVFLAAARAGVKVRSN